MGNSTGRIQFYITPDDSRYARIRCTSQLNLWSLAGPVKVTVRAVEKKQKKTVLVDGNQLVDLPDQTIIGVVDTGSMFFCGELSETKSYKRITPATVPPKSDFVNQAIGLVSTHNGYLANHKGEYLFLDVKTHTLFDMSVVFTTEKSDKKSYTTNRVLIPRLVADRHHPRQMTLQTSSDCFPSYATCLLETGSVIQMSNLLPGNRVMSTVGYSTVIGFSHRDLYTSTPGVLLYVKDSTGVPVGTLETTPGHLIPINSGTLVPAYNIKPGDTVTSRDSDGTPIPLEVCSVEETDCLGIVAPMTDSGTITVNGIDASCYTVHFNRRLADVLTTVLSFMYRRLPQPVVPTIIWLASSLYRSCVGS